MLAFGRIEPKIAPVESEPWLAFLVSGGQVEDDIRALLEPIVRDFNVDVLDVKLSGCQRRQQLQIIVDQAGGIASDMLTRISRALSLQLDAADLIDGGYELEVSSPGLDWPLRTAADFRRHIGERIQADFPDGSTLKGVNIGPDADGFLLLDDSGEEHHLGFDDTAKVKRQVNWQEAAR